MTDQKATLNELEIKLERIQERFNQLPEIYVSLIYFRETISAMREDHKELKSDVKEVLNLISDIRAKMDNEA